MPVDSLLDRASFRLRTKQFGAFRRYDDGRPIVVMSFAPEEQDRVAEWMLLRHFWLHLPPHPLLLDAITRAAGSEILLRHAAIHWRCPQPRVDATRAERNLVATWGAQLTDCLRHVWTNVPEAERGQFLRPLALIDLVNNVRVCFLPFAADDAQVPPEIQDRAPRCDETALVYVIGATIFELCTNLEPDEAEPIRSIVRRCVEPNPARRYQSLAALHAAWSPYALGDLTGNRAEAWRHAEEGVGWLEVDDPRSALSSFRTALHFNPRLRVALEGVSRTRSLLGITGSYVERRSALDTTPWHDAVERGARLEADRDFITARALYLSVRLDGSHDADVQLALARCELALGASGPAVDHAQRALRHDPHNTRAYDIACRGHLLAHRYADALALTSRWLEIAPSDPAAHYVAGRALLRLGRTTEARAAFDRAFDLDPKLLEAMLLSHHVGRSMKRVSTATGTSVPLTIEIPAQLVHLRDALLAGRVDDVIPVLESSAYGADPIAKLVHAECLAFAGRNEEALPIFDRAMTLSVEHRAKALIGKVHALLALGRPTDALSALDHAALTDVELADLRATALEQVGLIRDADIELRHVIADSEKRSNLRVDHATK